MPKKKVQDNSDESGSDSDVAMSDATSSNKKSPKETASSSTPKNKPQRATAAIPWIEKYRPKTVEDVVYQEEVIRTLQKAIETGSLPHLLFYGPPGTGKTSTILAVARQLYGPELYASRVLELNASDERGIDVIRNKVKTFAQVAVGQKPSGYNYPCPPFKLIILDEADSMTSDAQAALRRTMENYSRVTRFCIICNYISRIIDPITSRCAKFRFKALDTELLKNRIMHISNEEKLELKEGALDELIRLSEGDLRKAITFLQSSSRMYGKEASPNNIIEMAGAVPNDVLTGFFDSCRSNDFDKVQKATQNLIYNGYSASQVLSQFQDMIINDNSLSDGQKARISMHLSVADKNLMDGADEYLQLLNVASYVMRTLQFKE